MLAGSDMCFSLQNAAREKPPGVRHLECTPVLEALVPIQDIAFVANEPAGQTRHKRQAKAYWTKFRTEYAPLEFEIPRIRFS